MKLFFVTGNQNKLREAKQILGDNYKSVIEEINLIKSYR